MSPRLAPGGLPNSRSHTPQVPYPGYQGQQINGASQFPQPQHAPTPYQHLQPGGSANASPSPILPEFDQQAVQRVQTASPSPFSPAGIHVGPQISPSHSDHGSRVNTPQNSPFPPGQPYGQVVGSHFSPSPAMTSAGIHPAMQAQFNQSSASHLPQGFPHQPQQQQQQAPQQPPPPQQQQQMSSKQRPYQIRLQNQARQMQAVASPVSVGRPIGPGGTGQTPMQHPHMATMRQIQQNMAKPTSQEGFLQVLQRFWMSRGHPQVNLTPV
ncbi:arid/bright domain-containing protein, partial [Histoplasma capsulatum H143]